MHDTPWSTPTATGTLLSEGSSAAHATPVCVETVLARRPCCRAAVPWTRGDDLVPDRPQPRGTPAREESRVDNTSSDPSPTTDEVTIAETGSRPVGVFPPPRKLTAEQERELTRQYAETSTPIADIARTFSLSEVSVGRIAQRNGAASRRRRAVQDTTAEAPAAPLGVRRGRRRRADADREAMQEPSGDSRGRQPRADGRRAPTTRRRRAVSAADDAVPALSAPEPASQVVGGGRRRRYRIRFFAETVVEADNLREALGKAEALGATDITGIAQEDS